jgi:K+-sensing histidine kinase KdpD
MRSSAAAEIDIRAGASWLASLSPADRIQLLAALLSRFSHDLRTPLNTISGWSYLLQQESVEPARIRHGADVIARNGRDQMAMLDAFIEDARIAIGRLPLEPAAVRIDDAIAQAFAPGNGEDHSRSSPRIRIEAADAVIDGDGRLLQRLIKRLAAVSGHRTHDGAAVDLHVSREDRWICVSLTVRTGEEDWSDSDLLELRLGALMAAIFGGTLELLAGPATASIRLLLPEAAPAK